MKRARLTLVWLIGGIVLLAIAGPVVMLMTREGALQTVEAAGGEILFDFHHHSGGGHSQLAIPNSGDGHFHGEIRDDSWIKWVNLRSLGEPVSVSIKRRIESPDVFLMLSQFKELQRLEIGGFDCPEDALRTLRRCKKLGWFRIDSEENRNADSLLKEIANYRALQVLIISGMEVTDSGVQYLEGHPELGLFICDGSQLTLNGLRSLSRIPKLGLLSIGNTPKVGRADLEVMKKANPKWMFMQ